jgi:SAM-dependent methyltransferase
MLRDATYSKIITPEQFNRTTTEEHLHIADADNVIVNLIKREQKKKGTNIEVVEIGCGPARILPIVGKIPNIHLTGIDHDQGFLDYARKQLGGMKTKLVLSDAETYHHDTPVDVFYSQGVHHHIAKPPHYLGNLRKQLAEEGVILVSDEFISNYRNEDERRIRTTIWHAYIIADAIRNGYSSLAQEEAKILLDDLNTELDETRRKTKPQIDFVLESVCDIDNSVKEGGIKTAENQASVFLEKLEKMYSWELQDDPSLDLSRGDYKICDRVFREEANAAGLKVESVTSVGPIKNIGAMVIYALRKKIK